MSHAQGTEQVRSVQFDVHALDQVSTKLSAFQFTHYFLVSLGEQLKT